VQCWILTLVPLETAMEGRCGVSVYARLGEGDGRWMDGNEVKQGGREEE
jgi:hypothetical protein